jgi:hypothetical protein
MQGTNAYPSRSYPGQRAVPTPDPAVGGACGPADLPARVLVNFRHPGPSSPPHSGKGSIAQRQRSGAVVVMPGRSPGEQYYGEVQNEVFHGTIAWNRPTFTNNGPVAAYHNPTQMPSWSSNRVVEADAPVSPIPVSRHRMTAFTLREEYGSTRQFFPLWGTRRPLSGMNVQGQRWAAQAKTMNPYFPALTAYGLAGSYGQTTPTLKTGPVNAPGPNNAYGAY